MSRRTKLYRKRMGKDVGETTSKILAGHAHATSKGRRGKQRASGLTCSEPMDSAKAARIAQRLHKGK